MYFPFFACKAKSGTGELNVADKQNTYSINIAVQSIIPLSGVNGRDF